MSTRFRQISLESDEPTAETIELLTPWIVAASRPFADWYFGEPDVAAEIIGEWVARPTSELYAGRAIVAEDDTGRPAGCIVALPGVELARCRAADFASLCGEIESEPEADDVIAEIVTASNELFLPVADDELYISRVGVDPAGRGRGIGRALVEQAIEVFQDGHLAGCRLDVSADNAAAIRAYEAAGLTVTATMHSPTAGLTYAAMYTAL